MITKPIPSQSGWTKSSLRQQLSPIIHSALLTNQVAFSRTIKPKFISQTDLFTSFDFTVPFRWETSKDIPSATPLFVFPFSSSCSTGDLFEKDSYGLMGLPDILQECCSQFQENPLCNIIPLALSLSLQCHLFQSDKRFAWANSRIQDWKPYIKNLISPNLPGSDGGCIFHHPALENLVHHLADPFLKLYRTFSISPDRTLFMAAVAYTFQSTVELVGPSQPTPSSTATLSTIVSFPTLECLLNIPQRTASPNLQLECCDRKTLLEMQAEEKGDKDHAMYWPMKKLYSRRGRHPSEGGDYYWVIISENFIPSGSLLSLAFPQ